MLVEDDVIVELKSVESLLPIHKAQLLSYLKLSNKKCGLLINFCGTLERWSNQAIATQKRYLESTLPQLRPH